MHSEYSLNTKIGRLFMAGIPGKSLDDDTDALIRNYCIGGVILFSRNIEDPMQLATLCNDLQDRAIRYHGIPLFLAIDQEGGRVARLRPPFTVFAGNTSIGDDPNPVESAAEFGRITAEEMRVVGLNMDLAPVVDVRRGEPESHLVGRTFSDDPEKVALLGRIVVRALQKNGVMATAKHFPGLGRTALDPHFHLPTIDANLEEIKSHNLPPFQAAIEEGVSAIMTSHAIYPALDTDNPATLSYKILTDMLRRNLGFKGMVISDDLEMGAIKKHWGVSEGAVASFMAGNDILLICHNQGFIIEGVNSLRKKIIVGEISPDRLDLSLSRIERAKTEFLKDTRPVSLEEVSSYFKL
ncbi:Glycosyl hydrolase family 3 N-terminal domain protein [uncultured Desulfobacterium sp.]|uniref:Glycosyl hydrolase family 3 N-terminal domain protein n=1 Tax=uncultured Desulfobacterium sp. TaxID=201089 RepID=A0A445N3E3_9BACT|nr:Glycosyl hydrolase family 3 N-terminal domain protein [uncultured Desulfobacterium sp.]